MEFLETKINAIQLTPTFIAAIAVAILYFYVSLVGLNNATATKGNNAHLQLFMLISVALIGIPALAHFKKNKQAADIQFGHCWSNCATYIRKFTDIVRSLHEHV